MKNEVENIDYQQGNGVLPRVSGLLLLHDIEELDNIILELNSRKISLEEFVGKVWNTAYTLGQKDGYHCNNR
jgi:hypothetical protein